MTLGREPIRSEGSDVLPPASYQTTASPTQFTTAGITLNPSTTYWVALRATAGSLAWSWAGGNTGTGTGFLHAWGVSDDHEATWWSDAM